MTFLRTKDETNNKTKGQIVLHASRQERLETALHFAFPQFSSIYFFHFKYVGLGVKMRKQKPEGKNGCQLFFVGWCQLALLVKLVGIELPRQLARLPFLLSKIVIPFLPSGFSFLIFALIPTYIDNLNITC